MKNNLPAKELFLGKKIPGHEDYEVIEFIDSGCNAHVFRAYNDKLKNSVACKVIPVANINSSLLENDGWMQEAQHANTLKSPSVVACHFSARWIEVESEIDCALLCYEYVNGVSLRKYIKDNKNNIKVKFIRDYLSEIFQLLFEMKERGMQHGDLHSGNVLIEKLAENQLVPRLSFRVTDFSISRVSSELTIQDDYAQIAITLRVLLGNVNYQDLLAEDRFAFNVLNDCFLARHLTETDPTIDECARNPSILFERLNQIDKDYILREGEVESSKLITPFDYLSCEQIGDSHSVLKALYSDRFLGLSVIEAKNNLVLTGPRGCGKSTVFKSLSLFHRTLVNDDAPDKIGYIGVYYRCDDIYFPFPRYKIPERVEAIDLPIHFLISTLLIEVLNTIVFWGKKYFSEELEEKEGSVSQEIWNVLDIIPPAEPGVNTFSRITNRLNKERKRAAKKQRFVNDENHPMSNIFSGNILLEVCKVCSQSLSFIRGRPFYFFIDDYSAPKISLDLQKNLNRLVMQRTSVCFFKLSTESPVSFSVDDVDGKTYVESREFTLLNLGLKYLSEEVDKKLEFIEDVLMRRLNAVEDYPVKSLIDLVGIAPKISNNQMALKIKNKEKFDIWGKQALADLCSGDVHYIINLVGRMASEVGGADGLSKISNRIKISSSIQNRVIRDEAGNYLNNLRGLFKYGEKLVNIVTAFGNVAHSYIVYRTSKNNETSPLHQASRIEPFDELDLKDESEMMYKELLRYSVFIADRRGKSRRGKVVPRLWLRRFLIPFFNLTFSKRDSISLENDDIRLLLEAPKEFEKKFRLKTEVVVETKQRDLFRDDNEE